MSRPSAPADPIDALVGRRARWRAEGHSPRDRHEPRPGSPSPAHDADILEVVQKFERVYLQFEGQQGPTARAAPAFGAEEPAETSLDRDSTTSKLPSFHLDVRPATATESPIEKYELPQEPALQLGGAAGERFCPIAPKPRPRRAWPKVLAGAAFALLVGIGVGYMMVPSGGPHASRANIESSPEGGTRLRLDYELHTR